MCELIIVTMFSFISYFVGLPKSCIKFFWFLFSVILFFAVRLILIYCDLTDQSAGAQSANS